MRQDRRNVRDVQRLIEGNLDDRLVRTKSNRDAIGAEIRMKVGGLSLLRMVDGGNGYAGQSSKRVHFGLGAAAKIDSVEIRWPSGHVDKVTVPINKITSIREGGEIAK